MPRAMVASHPLFTGMTKGHEISTFVLHDIVGAQVPATRINKEHIVRYSAREIAEMLANGADRTDWSRVDALTDEDIKRFMREDTAWGDHIGVNWAGAEVVYPVAKKALSIRLDQDVIDFFQTQGRGYQTRINAVPRHFMPEKTRYKNKQLRLRIRAVEICQRLPAASGGFSQFRSPLARMVADLGRQLRPNIIFL
jgi:uncharacterized protein (DUF4415 family)